MSTLIRSRKCNSNQVVTGFTRRVILNVCFLQVLQKFPDGLQYEIHLHMHLTVLSDSFLFHDFEDSCLRALAKKMHRHHHLPGHQILHDGDDIESVHLVRRGKIDIMFHGEQRGRISKLSLECFLSKG